MTGRQWVESFMAALYELRHLANDEAYNEKDGKWTEFMVEKVINEGMAKKTDCQIISVVSKSSIKKEESGEYLNMDAMFIANSAYKEWKDPDYDPPVLPVAVVEHENDPTFKKIQYCLWKILCIRSDVRVLICYQVNSKKIGELKEKLGNTIKDRKLAERLKGELFLVIGDWAKNGIVWEKESDIRSYFSIFQWKSNRLIPCSFMRNFVLRD